MLCGKWDHLRIPKDTAGMGSLKPPTGVTAEPESTQDIEGCQGAGDHQCCSVPGPHPLSRKPGGPTYPLLPEAPSEYRLERQCLPSSCLPVGSLDLPLKKTLKKPGKCSVQTSSPKRTEEHRKEWERCPDPAISQHKYRQQLEVSGPSRLKLKAVAKSDTCLPVSLLLATAI